MPLPLRILGKIRVNLLLLIHFGLLTALIGNYKLRSEVSIALMANGSVDSPTQ